MTLRETLGCALMFAAVILAQPAPAIGRKDIRSAGDRETRRGA